MAQQLTKDILNAALENLTTKRRQIDIQITEIRRMMSNRRDGDSDKSEPRPRKHRISAAGRRAIAAAQRRRWATVKGTAESRTKAQKPSKPKRKLSAAGRRAIVAALKKRWAAKRAGTAKSAETAPKKAVTKRTKRAAKKATPATVAIVGQ
jgi:hypothetical protein